VLNRFCFDRSFYCRISPPRAAAAGSGNAAHNARASLKKWAVHIYESTRKRISTEMRREEVFVLAFFLLAAVSSGSSLHAPPAPILHDFKKPAFISFLPELGSDAMTVTSFDILCSNCKLSIVNTTTMEIVVLASLDWPNAVTYCPASVCTKSSLLVSSRDVSKRSDAPHLHNALVIFLSGWFRIPHSRPCDGRCLSPPGIIYMPVLYRLCCSDFDQALLLLRSTEVGIGCVICPV
jgi:hypothetical protein